MRGEHPDRGVCLLFELICRRSVGRKDAPCGRCFLRVRTSQFFGAAKVCPRSVGYGFRLWCPFVSLCSAGSSLSRRVGRCPTPCRGSAPVPAKGYRALGWAECASRSVFPSLFSPPTAYFCRPHFVWLGGIGCRGTPLPPAGPRRSEHKKVKNYCNARGNVVQYIHQQK